MNEPGWSPKAMKKVLRNPAKRRIGRTIGRAAYAKISAIEGVHLTAEKDQVLGEFEQENLAPAVPHRIIVSKYRSSASRLK